MQDQKRQETGRKRGRDGHGRYAAGSAQGSQTETNSESRQGRPVQDREQQQAAGHRQGVPDSIA